MGAFVYWTLNGLILLAAAVMLVVFDHLLFGLAVAAVGLPLCYGGYWNARRRGPGA